MMIDIKPADLTSIAFAQLVEKHVAFCDGTSPAESCHRLPISELATDDITVLQADYQDDIVGMGALKHLSKTDGEIKSMHTATAKRGLGIGQTILKAIISEAINRQYESLWLETGAHPDFAPARKLYQAHGFVECPPFGNYKEDPHSLFMTLDLKKGAAQ